MAEIVHERSKCIGCGACAAICPGNWKMAEDGKSQCKNTHPKEVGCNKDAADACPVKCISVK